MLVARGKRLLFADADGASKFSEFLEKLEREMVKTVKKSNNLAVVCGSRAHLEEESIAQVGMNENFWGFFEIGSKRKDPLTLKAPITTAADDNFF